MVGTGLAARVAMNGWRQHKATWEGAGPRTSVSPTTSCAWQWPAHQRFHPQPVLLLTSGDQAMLGWVRAGVGGPTPQPQMHHFCQKCLFLENTTPTAFVRHLFFFTIPLSGGTIPTDAPLYQICLFPFILNTNRSGPGQQFTASCLKIVLF